MKKYIQTDELQNQIDWDSIMKMPRYAGGHDEQMQGLFKDSEVVAHWNEGGYQGVVATCVKLSDGRYAIYNDYYGSCSGCDAWEGSSDDEIKSMCIGLSNSAKVFQSLDDVKDYLRNPNGKYDSDDKDSNYANWWSSWTSPAKHLLELID